MAEQPFDLALVFLGVFGMEANVELLACGEGGVRHPTGHRFKVIGAPQLTALPLTGEKPGGALGVIFGGRLF